MEVVKKYTYVLMSVDTGQRVVLQDSPKGWDANKTNIVRDFSYFGFFKTISAELMFIGDGYDFVIENLYNFGVDAGIKIHIYGGEETVTGLLNLATYDEDVKNGTIKCEFVQSAFVQSIKNRDKSKIDLLNPINADSINVGAVELASILLRGQTIKQLSQYNVPENDPEHLYHEVVPFTLFMNDNEDAQTPFGIELNGDIEDLLTPDSALYRNNLSTAQELTLSYDLEYTLDASESGIVTIPNGQQITGTSDISFRFYLLLCDAVGNATEIIDVWENLSPFNVALFGTFTRARTFTIDVPPNNFLVFANFRIKRYNTGSGTTDIGVVVIPTTLNFSQMDGNHKLILTYQKADLSIDIDSVENNTTHTAILPHELFDSLVAQVTGQKSRLYSDHYGRTDLGYATDGAGAYLAITTGGYLRRLPSVNRFTTTLEEAFRSYSAIDNLGLKIVDDVVIIEPKEMSGEIVATLGEVKDLKTQAADEFLFNSIKAGFPETDNETVNGITEFNTTTFYSNSIKSVTNELDISSKYRADGIGIEKLRRKSFVGGTEDENSDDKIFFIDCVQGEGEFAGQIISRRLEDIINATGIYSPETAFNLRISPGQNILRWSNYLAIPLHRKTAVVNFQTKEKFAELSMETDLGVTTDGQPIELPVAAMFLPEIKTFTSPVDPSVLSNPLGIIKYTYRGVDYLDYLYEVSIENDVIGEWKVISGRPRKIQPQNVIINALKYGDGDTDFILYDDDSLILY